VHALSTAGARGDVLAELVAGNAWATWVAGSCELRGAGDDVRLHGTVPVVADAGSCTWLLVPVNNSQVLVPVDAPGVNVRALEGLDVTRRWNAVELVDVPVATADAVECSSDALSALAAVLVAAESVGAMQADFDLALQYSKDRIAFGRPIGSFQAIKHLLADTSLWLEMAKALVTAAATALGCGASDGAELAHAAKAFVGERGRELAQNCFQVFGGIGYTWEHDQHFWLRRLASDAESFGSASAHRDQLFELAGVGR
jgi:alkylation response protein AidB-like acyl-CoA dehydrogenase